MLTQLTQYGPPELDHSFHDFLGRFQDQKFLASRQRDDGIRRNFDVLDQVRVHNQRDMVQPGELYHL